MKKAGNVTGELRETMRRLCEIEREVMHLPNTSARGRMTRYGAE